MLLGHLILGDRVPGAVTFPLLMGAFSIVASIIGSWLVGLGKVTKDGIMRALYLGMGVAGVLALVGFWFLSHMVFDSGQGIVLPNGTGAINATSVFVCALGDSTATYKSSAILAAGITVFGVLLFHYLLSIPFPLLRGFNL